MQGGCFPTQHHAAVYNHFLAPQRLRQILRQSAAQQFVYCLET